MAWRGYDSSDQLHSGFQGSIRDHIPLIEFRFGRGRALLCFFGTALGMESYHLDSLHASAAVSTIPPTRVCDSGSLPARGRLLVVPIERLLVPEEEDVDDGFAPGADAAEQLDRARGCRRWCRVVFCIF